MKKFNFIFKLALLAIFAIAVSREIQAQTAYGFSDIIYDNVTKQVTSYSGTYLDYLARLHYDPAVCGTMYREYTELGGNCYTGYNSSLNGRYGSLVKLRTNSPSPYDTRFDIVSDHYVVAYFYTDVTIIDDDGPNGPYRQWYDPFSLNKRGGQSLGTYNYGGQPNYDLSTFWDYAYFYLGSTGRSVIGNPTVCPDSFTYSLRWSSKTGH